MKKIYVALITPFKKDLSIDYTALKMIIEDLINIGCDGFIVCGTTGEASTLKEEEKFELLDFVIKQCNSKVEIYFGCGCNDTIKTLQLCKKAQNYAIDGLLLVTPYYNKPTQEGLYQHFSCIANNCFLPIILYQVENRCGCAFEVCTLKRLVRDCPNIKALKLASDNMDLAKSIVEEIPSLILYCGVDDKIKEYDEIGADGIVSVIGHICLNQLIEFYKKGNTALDSYFKEICKFVFLESNPIGIKYILSNLYPMENILRLPLTSLNDKNQEIVNTFFYK